MCVFVLLLSWRIHNTSHLMTRGLEEHYRDDAHCREHSSTNPDVLFTTKPVSLGFKVHPACGLTTHFHSRSETVLHAVNGFDHDLRRDARNGESGLDDCTVLRGDLGNELRQNGRNLLWL